MVRFHFAFLITASLFLNPGWSQDKTAASVGPTYQTRLDVAYRSESNPLIQQKCRLDVYHCDNKTGLSTVVWFHGGGLTGGKREIPKRLQDCGVNVVAASYRLSPDVTVGDCIDDAAAAVAWTINHIADFGGVPSKVFVSGHSAGGYLTSMIGLDKTRLQKYGVDADSIAGLIPFSGHTITHFTERKSRGIDGKQPIVDEMAPLFYVRKDCPPILFITGDRELEMLGRYEENAYMWRMMQVVGHDDAELMELDGYNHGQMADPAFPLLLRFIEKHSK
ncbi:alpha/beta hydrolase [Stieleria marina]|uniref:Carboxylesterase NlhH n=1 Tax=Stieleria marina TaxID=1930275 RepID=A0A517NS26_9BACT|nr:Carboxylesterase NlhH [Planctomycetes bacterium K23_9]